MTRHLPTQGLLLLAVAWMSCVRPGTQVRVSVDTDLVSVLSELRVRVFRSCDDVGAQLGAAGGRLDGWSTTNCALPPDTRDARAEIGGATPRSLDLVSDQTYGIEGASCAGMLRALPIRFPVIPESTCAEGAPYVIVEVTGRTRNGERPYQAIRQVRFQARRARDLAVFLTSCPCGVGYSCELGGACVPVVQPDDEVDAGSRDTGRPSEDAGTPSDAMFDAQRDAGGPCDATNCAPADACENAQCLDGVCQRTTRCGTGETCCAGGACALDCGVLTCTGQPAGMLCRPATSACDAPEVCDGASSACPADRAAIGGTVCRPAGDACDVTEVCDGTSTACPTDVFASFGTSCGGGVCNGAGACLAGCTPGGACNTGNPCEVGQIDCAPTRCVATGPAPAATVCRDVVGECDVEERCGGSTTCPPDSFVGAATPCRPATTVCDLPDYCTGATAVCPTDAFQPSGTQCRPSVGPCDFDEECTGGSGACPRDSNVYERLGFRIDCRSAAGACDVPESCGPADYVCPADALASGGVCRAAVGICDAPEACSGTSADCPPNVFMPDGSDCNQACGPESCAGGFCVGGESCIAPTPLCDCDTSCTHILSPDCK